MRLNFSISEFSNGRCRRLLGSLLAVLVVSAGTLGVESGAGVPLRLRVPAGWLDTASSYPMMATSLVVASATLLLVPVLLPFDRR